MAKLCGATGNYMCPVRWSTGHGITTCPLPTLLSYKLTALVFFKTFLERWCSSLISRMEQYGWLTRFIQLSIITLIKIHFPTEVETCISFRFFLLKGQCKWDPECEILRFPRNNFCMHSIVASRPNLAASAEIVHSYPLPQFCYTHNINPIYLWS